MGSIRWRQYGEGGLQKIPTIGREFKEMSFRDKSKFVLTNGQVAYLARVAPRTVSGWCDRGLIQHYKIPGSLDRRYRLLDVVAFLRQNGMPLNELEDYVDWRVLLIDPPVSVSTESLAGTAKEIGAEVAFLVSRSAVGGAASQSRNRPDVVLVYASVGRRAAVDLLAEYERDRAVWGRAYAVVDADDVETEKFLKDAGYWGVFRTDVPLERILHEIVVVAGEEVSRGVVSTRDGVDAEKGNVYRRRQKNVGATTEPGGD